MTCNTAMMKTQSPDLFTRFAVTVDEIVNEKLSFGDKLTQNQPNSKKKKEKENEIGQEMYWKVSKLRFRTAHLYFNRLLLPELCFTEYSHLCTVSPVNSISLTS